MTSSHPLPAAAPVSHTAPGASARAEGADAVLAKNLVVARVAAGMTQQELASAADISRATIAQIETGYSDPRLSTIAELAAALHVSPVMLLCGVAEVAALAHLSRADLDPVRLAVEPDVLARMERFAGSGMLKDRVRAARIGAAVARAAGKPGPAVIAAAIFSAIHPGAGTSAGTLLGELLANRETPPPPPPPSSSSSRATASAPGALAQTRPPRGVTSRDEASGQRLIR